MATFDNLVAESGGEPILTAIETLEEGVSAEYYTPVMECLDDNGDWTEVDLTGVTAEWNVLDKIGGTVIATFSTSIVGNQVKGTLAPGTTAGLAGTGNLTRRCPWYCTLTNGSSRKVSVFGPQDSALVIKQGA